MVPPPSPAELADLERAVEVAFALSPLAPPPPLRARLLARISAAPKPNAGLGVLRRGATPWKPTGVEGVNYRKLYLDPATGLMTTLLQLAPGARWPGHSHNRNEQCLVLEGEIRHAGTPFHAGDFIWAEAGSTDPLTTTPSGALLLIVSDPADEFIDAW